jgi:hypothetical protein
VVGVAVWGGTPSASGVSALGSSELLNIFRKINRYEDLESYYLE